MDFGVGCPGIQIMSSALPIGFILSLSPCNIKMSARLTWVLEIMALEKEPLQKRHRSEL